MNATTLKTKAAALAKGIGIVTLAATVVQTTYMAVHFIGPFIPGVTDQAMMLMVATADVAYGVITANSLKEKVVNKLFPGAW